MKRTPARIISDLQAQHDACAARLRRERVLFDVVCREVKSLRTHRKAGKQRGLACLEALNGLHAAIAEYGHLHPSHPVIAALERLARTLGAEPVKARKAS